MSRIFAGRGGSVLRRLQPEAPGAWTPSWPGQVLSLIVGCTYFDIQVPFFVPFLPRVRAASEWRFLAGWWPSLLPASQAGCSTKVNLLGWCCDWMLNQSKDDHSMLGRIQPSSLNVTVIIMCPPLHCQVFKLRRDCKSWRGCGRGAWQDLKKEV